jgi:hypothetical protein
VEVCEQGLLVREESELGGLGFVDLQEQRGAPAIGRVADACTDLSVGIVGVL